MLIKLKRDYARMAVGRTPDSLDLEPDLSCVSLISMLWCSVCTRGFRTVLLYRVGNWLYKRRIRVLASLVKRFNDFQGHCEISIAADISGGFVVRHTEGLVVGGGTKIGEDCEVRQGITFGGNQWKTRPDGRHQPLIHKNVKIGAGAKILGPVEVGENSSIGANAVVIADIPSNSVAVGVPARVIRRNGKQVPLDEQCGGISKEIKELKMRIAALETKEEAIT